MRKDFQNYHGGLKALINNSDAHMFLDKFKRMKENNPSFYYAYELDDESRLRHVFWVDGTSRKNYILFGDVVTFDTTYRINKYDLIFAPFTGINHHRQSISFGSAFLANEEIESFIWLFEHFLMAMEGRKPFYIITDQDPAMKSAIEQVFDTSVHRFCLWHIMKKIPEKVGGVVNSNNDFHHRLKACVWASESADDFQSSWWSLISDYGLVNNGWFTQMFNLKHMWAPAYFRDVPFGGLLRITSRSESENAMFNNYMTKQLSLVEFWMRYECAIDRQRENEREKDNASISSSPKLKTSLELENHGREIYTHKNFYIFQDELWSACMECGVCSLVECDGMKKFIIKESSNKPMRTITYVSCTEECTRSCKMYELERIPCRHILFVLKQEMAVKIPRSLKASRWTKYSNRASIMDANGNLLMASSTDGEGRPLVRKAWASINEVMSLASDDDKRLTVVVDAMKDLKLSFNDKVVTLPSKSQQLELYVGSSAPIAADIEIQPPLHSKTKGSGKRIKGGKEMAMEKKRRLCKRCGRQGYHDSRNCPLKVSSTQ